MLESSSLIFFDQELLWGAWPEFTRRNRCSNGLSRLKSWRFDVEMPTKLEKKKGRAMPGLLPNVDPDGLLEFSVVYTDRALNHMSKRFQRVVCDISAILKQVYGARSVVLVPGSGTFGMEQSPGSSPEEKRLLFCAMVGSVIAGARSLRWGPLPVNPLC